MSDIASNRRELQQQVLRWKREKSNMPYPKPEAFPWKSGKDIENLIFKHCKMLSWYGEPIACSIIDVNGSYIPGVGFAVNNSTKGVSDLALVYKGKIFWIEAKYGKDTQKPDQKKWQEIQEKAGATYLIVKKPEDWFVFIKDLLS